MSPRSRETTTPAQSDPYEDRVDRGLTSTMNPTEEQEDEDEKPEDE